MKLENLILPDESLILVIFHWSTTNVDLSEMITNVK